MRRNLKTGELPVSTVKALCDELARQEGKGSHRAACEIIGGLAAIWLLVYWLGWAFDLVGMP